MWVWQSLRKQDTKQDDEKGKKRDNQTPAACGAPECGECCAGLCCVQTEVVRAAGDTSCLQGLSGDLLEMRPSFMQAPGLSKDLNDGCCALAFPCWGAGGSHLLCR